MHQDHPATVFAPQPPVALIAILLFCYLFQLWPSARPNNLCIVVDLLPQDEHSDLCWMIQVIIDMALILFFHSLIILPKCCSPDLKP